VRAGPGGLPPLTERLVRRRVRRASAPAGPPRIAPDLPGDVLPVAGQTAEVPETPALDLLIWDAPNIDMTLSTVIGARPTAETRPRFDAIAAWFVEGAGDPESPDAPEVEACVFANIPPVVGTLQRWVEALRSFGFAVFARPKNQPDDDIDQAMLDHIAVRAHVPGAFAAPLDRVRLDNLPPDGAWLRPTRSLREFVSSFTARRSG
jgi:uncharacterized protein